MPSKSCKCWNGSRVPENKNSRLVPNVLKVKNREIVMVGIEELEPAVGQLHLKIWLLSFFAELDT